MSFVEHEIIPYIRTTNVHVIYRHFLRERILLLSFGVSTTLAGFGLYDLYFSRLTRLDFLQDSFRIHLCLFHRFLSLSSRPLLQDILLSISTFINCPTDVNTISGFSLANCGILSNYVFYLWVQIMFPLRYCFT